MNELLVRLFPRRPGPLALLLAGIAAVLAAGVARAVVPSSSTGFTSTALVSLDTPRAIALARDGGILNKLSGVRLKYVGLVQTDVIAAPVAKQLGLPVDQVRGRLSALALPTDLLLRVSCTGADARAAQQCAQALSASLIDFITREQAGNSIPPILAIVASAVQPPGPGVATSSHPKRVLALALLVGALAAALVLGAAARAGSPAVSRP